MTAIDKKPGFMPLMKDIYNLRQKLRDEELNGRTPIVALMDFFKSKKWVH